MEEAKFAVLMRIIHRAFELYAGSSSRQSTFHIDGLGRLPVALTSPRNQSAVAESVRTACTAYSPSAVSALTSKPSEGTPHVP